MERRVPAKERPFGEVTVSDSISVSPSPRTFHLDLQGFTTGASHASHLGCPSAYSSRVLYIKKRQVWKPRSETDWPHLGIMPDFSTEKNRSILMLTSTCWQEISLSNTVELTTVTAQKQKICRFKRFLPVFENSRGSIVCLRAANPVTRHDWVVLFLRTSAGCHTETGWRCSSRILSPLLPACCRIAWKFPSLSVGSASTSVIVLSRCPLIAMFWRPQRSTVSTIASNLRRLAATRSAKAVSKHSRTLWRFPAMMVMKLLNFVTATWWHSFCSCTGRVVDWAVKEWTPRGPGLHWLRLVGQRPTEVCWETQLGAQQGIICCIV